MRVHEFFEPTTLEDGASSQWGSPEDICRDVLQTIERDIEWPLTEILPADQVSRLLAPLVKAVNDKLMQAQSQGGV